MAKGSRLAGRLLEVYSIGTKLRALRTQKGLTKGHGLPHILRSCAQCERRDWAIERNPKRRPEFICRRNGGDITVGAFRED